MPQSHCESIPSIFVNHAIQERQQTRTSDSSQHMSTKRLLNSADAELRFIDRLVESPEVFSKLPTDEQAAVLFWILFVCEYLPQDIKRGLYPRDTFQKFNVTGRNYEEYCEDLRYLLHAANLDFPGLLRVYLEYARSYRRRSYRPHLRL